MAKPPKIEFGKRRPAVHTTAHSPPVKRSHHVALLLAGTLAVGGTAYSVMQKQDCAPGGPGQAAPSSATCSSRSSSSGGGYYGGSSRSGFYGGSSNSSSTSSASSETARGGFGGFGRAFAGFSGT